MLWWTLLAACSTDPSVGLSRPNAVAVGADGTVYVSDFGHDRILQVSPDGDVVRAFGRPGLGAGELWRVYALTVDAQGALLVANRRPDDAASSAGDTWEVKRFMDGKEVSVKPFMGHFTSSSHAINSMAPTDDGGLLVANPAGGELFLLDAEGRFVGAFGGALREDDAPHAVARDGDRYWVVDQRSHRIYSVDGQGQHALVLSVGEAGPLSFPSAIGICPGKWIAVADLGNHRVQRFDLEGQWLGGFEPERAGPDQPVQLLGLAVTADCERLYLADSKGDRVLVTTPEGVLLHTVDGQ